MSACPTCGGDGPHVEETDCPTPAGLDARLLNALTHRAYREIVAFGTDEQLRPSIRRYLIQLWTARQRDDFPRRRSVSLEWPMGVCRTCGGQGPHVEATDCPTPAGLNARLLNALTHRIYREVVAAEHYDEPVRPIIRRYLIEFWTRARGGA